MAKCITLDSCRQDSPSEAFLRCLNTMPYAQINRNCWIVDSDKNCVQLRDMLKQEISPNDSLFVTTCGPEAAWCNTVASAACIRKILNSCS